MKIFSGKLEPFWPWVCAALSGILLALCYEPASWGGLSWLALTPLICAIWLGKSWNKHETDRAFYLGFLTGFVYFLGSLQWLVTVTGLGWVLLSLYLALYPAFWGMLVGTVARPRESPGDEKPVWMKSWNNLRIALLAATAWTGLEWIRGTLFSGFGWNGLGVALHDNIALIQIADIMGVGGISFLLVMVNVMIVITIKRLTVEVGHHKLRPHYDFSLTVAIVAVVFAYGVREMFAPPKRTEPLTFAAIQANIPIIQKRDMQFEEHILDLHTELTEKAMAMHPDLIIWPEAATPRPLFQDKGTWDVVHDLTKKHDGDFLLGSVLFDATGDYNSAFLLTDHGKAAQWYNKMHLVPFGEYLPLRGSFPPFEWVAGSLIPEDFDAGPKPVVLGMNVKKFHVATLICFEDTLGDLARQFALLKANFFVTLTNDGWFLTSAGPAQHLENAVFRCVETKLPMIRAANSGVSCAIDQFGRVVSKLEDRQGNTHIEGFLTGKIDVPLHPVDTFYTTNGEIFSIVCLGIAAISATIFLLRRIRS